MGQGIDYLTSLKKWDGKGGFRLDSIREVLAALGDPHKAYPMIHVAGTNGKGSTCAACASILGASGAKVGLTISPHLTNITERIVIDGHEINISDLDLVGKEIDKASRKVSETLSFHEAITTAAFYWFRECKVDYAVIEVGLGGRLDASNVIEKPLISIITSISYDHEEILGKSLSEIAIEKGGIIKKNAPTIIGKLPEEAGIEIRKIANALNSKLYVFGEDFHYQGKSPLAGHHQHTNIAIAVKVAELLEIPQSRIDKGVENLHWPARLEHIVYQNKKVLLDCAHNLEGVGALADYLKINNYNKLIIGFGALQSKPWKEMINMLLPYVAEWHLLEPFEDRAVSDSELEGYLSSFDIKSKVYGRDYGKFINYINMLNDNSMILLTGSIYLLGMIRSYLQQTKIPLWKRIT